ncbi:thioredoxin family protein [Rhodonellum sp.]|uniref:thioredoxin family protein n=1 Tax=Rhodonellum sp. TaxID=2231180 RepID=UPI00271C150E|nr:thioredoxin family protein [Rhodonellum sp.]MDO9552681.1 thioredoxin family protein [Rhodonellum sp.]
MKNKTILMLGCFLWIGISFSTQAQEKGYSVGDKASDFELKNVDGKMVSLSGLKDVKGAIVIFSCNTCPYVVAYEDRMIALHQKYESLGYPLIAINPNDDKVSPKDSFENMQKRAKDKNFPFAYVHDKKQEVIKSYGGSRTPHVYLLKKEDNDYVVKYIGAIDNNHQDASSVTEKYLENAMDAVLSGNEVALKTTKAIGCTIKWTKP